MSRVEISTLNAEVEANWDEDVCSETVEVILRFGDVEIMRWPGDAYRARYSSERQEYVEEFIAEKLRALFGGAK